MCGLIYGNFIELDSIRLQYTHKKGVVELNRKRDDVYGYIYNIVYANLFLHFLFFFPVSGYMAGNWQMQKSKMKKLTVGPPS